MFLLSTKEISVGYEKGGCKFTIVNYHMMFFLFSVSYQMNFREMNWLIVHCCHRENQTKYYLADPLSRLLALKLFRLSVRFLMF